MNNAKIVKKLSNTLTDEQRRLLAECIEICQCEQTFAPLLAAALIDYNYKPTQTDINRVMELQSELTVSGHETFITKDKPMNMNDGDKRKKLHITIGGYTGTGKTTMAMKLYQFLCRNGFNHVTIEDADYNNEGSWDDYLENGNQRWEAISKKTDVAIQTRQHKRDSLHSGK